MRSRVVLLAAIAAVLAACSATPTAPALPETSATIQAPNGGASFDDEVPPDSTGKGGLGSGSGG